MSTAVAAPTATALPSSMNREVSPKGYPPLAPSSSSSGSVSSSSSSTSNRAVSFSGPSSSSNGAIITNSVHQTGPHETSPKNGADGRISPKSSSRGAHPPKIIVKQEPAASPEIASSRHRPRRLDLSKGSPANQPVTSRPSANPLNTAREGSGMGIQDVGLACLSPGFMTQDPTMREQLQRSISVRDQQRHIIESRLQRSAKPGEADTPSKTGENASAATAGLKTPSSRRRPPPGLSIVAPPHEQFANERVIQSAPLRPSFPGRHQPEPLTRHVANQPSNLATTSHIHHVPATQTNNRLPPITDVLGVHRDGSRTGYFPSHSNSNSAHSASRPTFPSPGHPPPQLQQPPPPPQQAPSSAGRPREYRSAEEAVASMSGGREDLLPKIIHYGAGHQQPPTPPSPLTATGMPPHKLTHSYSSGDISRHASSRRRTRVEYERDMGSPPLGSGPDARRGPFGEGRDSPDTQRKKKDEFLSICARAWDLFHS